MRIIRRILWGIAGLIGLLLIGLVILSFVYSPEYVLRILRWGNSDVYDYQKFGSHPVENAPPVFNFQSPDDPAAAEARVRAAFEQDVRVDDLDTFLEENQTQGFIVVQDDTLLYEHYYNGFSHDSIVTSFSMAKSFDSAMIGAAIGEGKIASMDDPITLYLPELTERDPRFENITVRNLLDMSSGISYVEYPFFTADDALTYYFPDLRTLALKRTRIAGEPGETFLYNNFHPLMEGVILERVTGITVAEYLQESIWKQIGMEYPATWSIDSEETQFEKMESGINAHTIDFAKFGRLYLNGGMWDGRQVLPAEWVDASTHLNPAIDVASYFPPEYAIPEGQIGYSLHWWLLTRPDGMTDYAALGNFGQYIYVAPAEKIIIARNGVNYGDRAFKEWLGIFVQAAERLGEP